MHDVSLFDLEFHNNFFRIVIYKAYNNRLNVEYDTRNKFVVFLSKNRNIRFDRNVEYFTHYTCIYWQNYYKRRHFLQRVTFSVLKQRESVFH